MERSSKALKLGFCADDRVEAGRKPVRFLEEEALAFCREP